MRGHRVHELEACPLVRARQQRAAIGVDAAHPLQRAEKGVPDLRALRTTGSGGVQQRTWALGTRVYTSVTKGVPCLRFAPDSTSAVSQHHAKLATCITLPSNGAVFITQGGRQECITI